MIFRFFFTFPFDPNPNNINFALFILISFPRFLLQVLLMFFLFFF
jgi:hypothetical protein